MCFEIVQCCSDAVQIDRPSFLNPEANKKSKVCAAHVSRRPTAEAAAQQQRQQQAEARAREADITKMAPKLRGQPDTQAVLSAPAQRRTGPAGEKKPALIGNDALVRPQPDFACFRVCVFQYAIVQGFILPWDGCETRRLPTTAINPPLPLILSGT